MRVASLHRDVILLTSAIWQTNCVVLRGPVPSSEKGGVEETFTIDSPVLPDELDTLAGLIDGAGFPPVSGLMVTHADWDHLLAKFAFPEAALGCAESTAQRLTANPGEAQRELRAFDEAHYLRRARPLTLGASQALPVPGRCEIGGGEIELHTAEGHTDDGMAIVIPWARVVVLGDYLSSVEIPVLGESGSIDLYLATLARLAPLVDNADHVVPGHGPVLDAGTAATVLAQDSSYLRSLLDHGPDAELPPDRRGRAQRRLHAENVARLEVARSS